MFPMERIPADQQIIHPDILYQVFSKAFIPQIPCPQPKLIWSSTLVSANNPNSPSKPEMTLPCVIKTTHGRSGQGTFMVRSTREYDDAWSAILAKEPMADVVITEMVDHVTCQYNAYMYISRAGKMKWLGTIEALIADTDDFVLLGGMVDISTSKQAELEELLKPSCEPVLTTLHKRGFFGVVGIEVLIDKHGDQYVIDINPRLNASMPHMMIAPKLLFFSR
jgi:biotin carboxylase